MDVDWPDVVRSLYDPVKVLGTGGFASVVLARRKVSSSSSSPSPPPTRISTSDTASITAETTATETATETTASALTVKEEEEPTLVAIKVVGHKQPTKQEIGYAHRELDIVRELSHPGIMKVIRYWEPPVCSRAVMALSYASGPTLQAIVSRGGATSHYFCRIVAAQLVDVVAYLHSRAVLHRDIKPDNMIITGASLDQDDDIWDNAGEIGTKGHAGIDTKKDATYWTKLYRRWHLTIVDFGLARALTPKDMLKDLPPETVRTVVKDVAESSHFSVLGESTSRSGRRSAMNVSTHGRSIRSLRRSTSREFKRQMSAVGNRMFAAPEVQHHVRRYSIHEDSSRGGGANSTRSMTYIDVTKTLSEYVSFYGMMADAFSVGTVLRVMATGVPPDQDIQGAIAAQNHPMGKLIVYCCVRGDTGTGRKVHYRSLSAIQPEALRLIKGMTIADPQRRTSVRTALRYPYIDDVLPADRPQLPHDEVQYLSFAMKDSKE
jgi:serine/threonine protein kinase